jgi:predicted O-methyltransferase YrrM
VASSVLESAYARVRTSRIRRFVQSYCNLLVARRLARRGRHPLAEELAFVRSFRWLGFKFSPFAQLETELLQFAELVAELSPKRIVEIGTARGETAFLLTRAAADDATLVCVDLPAGPFGGVTIPNRHSLWKSFALPHQTVHLLERDSHDPGTVELVEDLVGRIDVLLIDGDHTYDGVKGDFEMYGPLVEPGGLVAFHDVVPGPDAFVGMVHRFWPEVRGDRFIEIVDDWDQGGYGFGIIEKPGSAACRPTTGTSRP